MGPEAAINAVFYNQIQAIEDPGERAEFVEAKRAEFAADIDILHLASELVVDAVIEPDALRPELVRRFSLYEGKDRDFSQPPNAGHAGLSWRTCVRVDGTHLSIRMMPFCSKSCNEG